MVRGDFSWGGLIARASLLATAIRPQAREVDTYTEKAKITIERLNADWYNANTGIWDNAWWNSANSLTTMADFTTLRLDVANRINIGGIMRTTFTNAQKTNVQTMKTMTNGLVVSTYCLDWADGCMASKRSLKKRGYDDFINEFYDDEGWWALAWIRSHDAAGDMDFLEAAVDIFNDMQGGGGTPCGGIYWKKGGPYVNAIANELYLAVAASLARRVPDNSTYLEIAKKQWQWFEGSGMINSKGLINDGLTDDCKNNGLQTWSYNQGVILGALVELSRATGNKALIEKAHRIATAAIEELTNSDGILVEADDCELRDGHCGRDGQQFKGIFVRNLHYLHEASPKDLYRRFIIKNADSVWKNARNKRNQLGVAWTGPYVEASGPSQSSGLDALVAAIAVLDK